MTSEGVSSATGAVAFARESLFAAIGVGVRGGSRRAETSGSNSSMDAGSADAGSATGSFTIVAGCVFGRGAVVASDAGACSATGPLQKAGPVANRSRIPRIVFACFCGSIKATPISASARPRSPEGRMQRMTFAWSLSGLAWVRSLPIRILSFEPTLGALGSSIRAPPGERARAVLHAA